MDGARIVTVEVRPLQYRPLTRRLFLVNNIQFEFSFSSNVLPELRPQIRGIYEQEVYDAALRDVVMNDYEIPAYYQQPTLVEESQHQNEVAITIYDATGSIVNELTGLNLKPGYHERTIDINNLSSGVYFVVLKQDEEKVAKKIILAR